MPTVPSPYEQEVNLTNLPVNISVDCHSCSSIYCILQTLNKDKGDGHKQSIVPKSCAAQYPFEIYP